MCLGRASCFSADSYLVNKQIKNPGECQFSTKQVLDSCYNNMFLSWIHVLFATGHPTSFLSICIIICNHRLSDKFKPVDSCEHALSLYDHTFLSWDQIANLWFINVYRENQLAFFHVELQNRMIVVGILLWQRNLRTVLWQQVIYEQHNAVTWSEVITWSVVTWTVGPTPCACSVNNIIYE